MSLAAYCTSYTTSYTTATFLVCTPSVGLSVDGSISFIISTSTYGYPEPTQQTITETSNLGYTMPTQHTISVRQTPTNKPTLFPTIIGSEVWWLPPPVAPTYSDYGNLASHEERAVPQDQTTYSYDADITKTHTDTGLPSTVYNDDDPIPIFFSFPPNRDIPASRTPFTTIYDTLHKREDYEMRTATQDQTYTATDTAIYKPVETISLPGELAGSDDPLPTIFTLEHRLENTTLTSYFTAVSTPATTIYETLAKREYHETRTTTQDYNSTYTVTYHPLETISWSGQLAGFYPPPITTTIIYNFSPVYSPTTFTNYFLPSPTSYFTTSFTPSPTTSLTPATTLDRREYVVDAGGNTILATQYPTVTTGWWETKLPNGLHTWIPIVYTQTFPTTAPEPYPTPQSGRIGTSYKGPQVTEAGEAAVLTMKAVNGVPKMGRASAMVSICGGLSGVFLSVGLILVAYHYYHGALFY